MSGWRLTRPRPRPETRPRAAPARRPAAPGPAVAAGRRRGPASWRPAAAPHQAALCAATEYARLATPSTPIGQPIAAGWVERPGEGGPPPLMEARGGDGEGPNTPPAALLMTSSAIQQV